MGVLGILFIIAVCCLLEFAPGGDPCAVLKIT